MFYVTFFIDFLSRPFLAAKLGKFLDGDYSRARLHSGGADRPVRSADELPLPADNYVYSSFWFLHGESQGGSATSASPNHKLYHATSYARLNALLRDLALKYRWALVPWGGTEEFMSLAFVTSERTLHDRFVDCSENSVEPYRAYENILGASVGALRYNPLISSYAVENALEDVCKACLFLERYEEIGRRVLEVCGCAEVSPYVFYRSPDGGGPPSPLTDEHGQPLDPVYETPGHSTSSGDAELYLCRPRDTKTFMALCRLGGDNTLFVVPGTVDVEEVRRVVEMQAGEYAFSDLVQVQNILTYSEWFYAPRRGHVDDQYSLFGARESGLIKVVTQPGSDADQYPLLISCF